MRWLVSLIYSINKSSSFSKVRYKQVILKKSLSKLVIVEIFEKLEWDLVQGYLLHIKTIEF
jgi:hypothetical protein